MPEGGQATLDTSCFTFIFTCERRAESERWPKVTLRLAINPRLEPAFLAQAEGFCRISDILALASYIEAEMRNMEYTDAMTEREYAAFEKGRARAASIPFTRYELPMEIEFIDRRFRIMVNITSPPAHGAGCAMIGAEGSATDEQSLRFVTELRKLAALVSRGTDRDENETNS